MYRSLFSVPLHSGEQIRAIGLWSSSPGLYLVLPSHAKEKIPSLSSPRISSESYYLFSKWAIGKENKNKGQIISNNNIRLKLCFEATVTLNMSTCLISKCILWTIISVEPKLPIMCLCHLSDMLDTVNLQGSNIRKFLPSQDICQK